MIGRLTAFELSNFDNFKYENVESSFKDKLSLKEPKEKKKRVKYVSSDSNIDEEDVEKLEAQKVMIFHKGKGKFKGKLPIMCFNCNEVGHIAARCSKKKNYRGGDKYKSRTDEENKEYKDKGKKSCYLLKRKLKMDLTVMMMKWCMWQ